MRAALLALALAVGPEIASAQDAGARPAILTLDQERFFVDSAFGKAALEREAAATSALAAENLRIEQELETEERDLTTRRSTLATDEFARLAAAFDAKVERIRAEQDAKSRDIGRAREADRQRFLQSAVPILGDLLSDQAAVAIIDKGAIILSLSSIDVTNLAIARVDAVLGDGSAALPRKDAPAPAPKAAP